MQDIKFTNEHTSTGVADTVNTLRQPRLWIPTDTDYPNHGDWLDKTEAQLLSGQKRAMTAYMGRKAVGTVIYQRKVGEPSALEIKNISVSDDARGRYIGGFLLRNSELEASRNDFPGVSTYVLDTKITNTNMIAFLESQGYNITDISDLYGLGAGLDVILSKPVK